MSDTIRQASWVFGLAFIVRLAGAAATTVTRSVNPASQKDAVQFGQTAATIAQGLPESIPVVIDSGPIGTYQLWGSFLSPFWLLPGPSGFYARVANCLLGAFAVYNVYIIARYYHSHRAGVFASAPMIVYPSFVAVHSTLLREAIVLFGLTTAARLVIVKPTGRSWRSYIGGLAVLYLAYVQRTDNLTIYAVTVAAGLIVYGRNTGVISRRTLYGIASVSPVVFVLSLPILRDGVEYLAKTRQYRAHGDAAYLSEVIPQTVGELIGFSWIGAAYFLYTPFPWMIRSVPGILIGVEGMINVGYTVAGIFGSRFVAQRDSTTGVALLVGFAVAVTLYGVGTANYGAAMRHRQMFVWVVFLLGGVGLANKVRAVTGDSSTQR